MKVGGILVVFGQSQDLRLGMQLPHKSHGTRRSVLGETVGHHHTGVSGEIGQS